MLTFEHQRRRLWELETTRATHGNYYQLCFQHMARARICAMDLAQLETFIHVVEHGSFSKAALVLGVAQPSLSRQVRALEVELHEQLLLRHGRGVKLTESGRHLLERCHDILHLVAKTRDEIAARRDEPTGQISIAMTPTLARLHTLPLIRAFRSAMPKARLAVIEGFSAHITEWVTSGRADIGLVHNPEPLPSLDIKPLQEARLFLVSLASQAPSRPVPIRALANYPLVMPERGHIFRKLAEATAAMAGVQLRVEWEVSSIPVILDLVAAGMGHAALGEDAIQRIQHCSRLVVTPIVEPGITFTLCLVASAQRRETPLRQRTAALLEKLLLSEVSASPGKAIRSGKRG